MCFYLGIDAGGPRLARWRCRAHVAYPLRAGSPSARSSARRLSVCAMNVRFALAHATRGLRAGRGPALGVAIVIWGIARPVTSHLSERLALIGACIRPQTPRPAALASHARPLSEGLYLLQSRRGELAARVRAAMCETRWRGATKREFETMSRGRKELAAPGIDVEGLHRGRVSRGREVPPGSRSIGRERGSRAPRLRSRQHKA